MAKKQTRRSISVSRTTYERLKAFCETNHISMSQLVETRVNDFLGPGEALGEMPAPAAIAASSAPRPMAPLAPRAIAPLPSAPSRPVEARPQPAPAPAASAPAPMTSAAARFAIDPPPPIIKPRQDTAAPKPAEKRPDQIFTF
jgi:hypothetical protein